MQHLPRAFAGAGDLCVETVADLWALERALIYRGRYHVLGGSLSALAGRGPEDLAISSLLARLHTEPPREIIFGDAGDGGWVRPPAIMLAEKLKPFGIPISRLAQVRADGAGRWKCWMKAPWLPRCAQGA